MCTRSFGKYLRVFLTYMITRSYVNKNLWELHLSCFSQMSTRNRKKYIEIVFHKYLQGALRNTFLFSAGKHPYPASPQPLTSWIMTSQATKQQYNKKIHLEIMITWCCIMQWNMPWWKLHFFAILVLLKWIIFSIKICWWLQSLHLPSFSSKNCAENEKWSITKAIATSLSQ